MMRETDRYWLKDKSVPFSVLLNMLQKYYHPEVDDFEDLLDRARHFDAGDGEMATFKEELVTLLEGNRDGLHPQALSLAAGYDQRNDDEFLVWLWRELYPDESVPSPQNPASPGSE